MRVPAKAVRLLSDAERVLLASHVPPDGDGLGSALALLRHLRSRGRFAVFAAGGPVQDCLHFLFGPDEVDLTEEGPPGEYDLVVSLDSATLARLGPLASRCRAAPALLNIDHHATNERYGTVDWIEGSACAVGEMTYHLLREMAAVVDVDLALPLYVAIVTDTGRFGYSSTTPESLRIGAELLQTGIRPEEVTDRIYRSLPESFLRLTALALERMETLLEGRVAHVTATPRMIERSGAAALDVGDLVDLPISMAGVEVALLFREVDGGTKVSFRSRDWFPVHDLAARFGGGGHPRAAGATVALPLEAARREVLAALEEEFARHPGGRA
jgi:phosphoesterase RecJ-like protein